ncbi:SDR family oxidoreductase [Leptolyngbya sp. FACHB-671]|uniref:SDR family oxidoreductase n=1 Tax=Leptolyngbya sp. FACHB-671 TaxID=2692812 RepID=UPI001682AD73|nr:SDR family oxidoreductase [Leptolyngbya sp. FACHB-671]MBD1867820.1 SDR family oxidoreductase [Cyanobacteria bacterium FACHB-471]MBD2068466.1 SDR family oxidoreductase [Leptolyngbya sp. FACHB-671]
MTLDLKHRALITGASSGIGKATALSFAKAGIDLVLVSRNQSRLDAVAAEAMQIGVEVQVCPVDLAAIAQVKAEISRIAERHGPINILINSAGVGYTGGILETSLEDWQQVLTLNLTSVLQCIQAVLPGMRDRHSGTIVNVASIAAYQAFPNWGAYNVSKAGLLALSKTLAAEERSNGIRVVTVSPGAVNTALWDTDFVHADFDRSKMLTPETVAESILHTVLLPTQAVIEELTLMPSAGAL